MKIFLPTSTPKLNIEPKNFLILLNPDITKSYIKFPNYNLATTESYALVKKFLIEPNIESDFSSPKTEAITL